MFLIVKITVVDTLIIYDHRIKSKNKQKININKVLKALLRIFSILIFFYFKR